MTREEKRQLLKKQIARIEKLIKANQPARDIETRRITRRLDRHLMQRKQKLIMLSF